MRAVASGHRRSEKPDPIPDPAQRRPTRGRPEGRRTDVTKPAAGVRRIPLPTSSSRSSVNSRFLSPYSGVEDPVFASKEGTPLGHRNLSQRGFEPAPALAGIEKMTFHDMRHAFAI